MEFSVLMSVYSKENPAFLREAVLSISEAQTLKPSEIVLIEDGPLTGELDAVIRELGELIPYLKTFQLSENVGLGRALNYGLTKCQYDWVARMDSDDIAAPNRFEVQINYLKHHPEVDIIGSHIQEFNNVISDAKQKRLVPLNQVDIKQMAKTRNPMNHVTVIFNKQKIIEAGSYNHILYVEDYELWVRCIVAGYQLVNLDDVLVYVRVGNGMAQRRSNREYISSWKKLNQYMYQHKLVTKFEVMKNMLAIRLFIYMPVGLKKFLYDTVLRSNAA